MTEILLGCQDWRHSEWVGSFYPSNTRDPDMLRWYAAGFNTVEVSDTFRGIPPEPLVREWRDAVPGGFVFALKVPQQVTHERRFVGADGILRRFLDRVTVLGDRLGPLLLTMSPGFTATNEARAAVISFISSLPQGFKWAIEFRHADWLKSDMVQALSARRVATALVEGRWIRRSRMLELARAPTADFAYVRWSDPPRGSLARADNVVDHDEVWSSWTEILRRVGALVGTIYGYFGNRFSGNAPHDVKDFYRSTCGAAGEVQNWRRRAETD